MTNGIYKLTSEVTTTSSTSTTLCVFAVLTATLAAISLIVVHFLRTGVNPITDAVSDYGAGKHKMFYIMAAFWLGAAGLLVAAALATAVFPKPTYTIISLLIFAATRTIITIYPTDLPGEQETDVGRAHFALAVAAFVSIAVAGATFPIEVNDDRFWRPHQGVLVGLGAALVLTALAAGVMRRIQKPHVFGLMERLLYVAMFAWIISVAAILATG